MAAIYAVAITSVETAAVVTQAYILYTIDMAGIVSPFLSVVCSLYSSSPYVRLLFLFVLSA